MALIPQIEPWIDDDELKEIVKVIQSTFISEHSATREFEKIVKEFTGAKHVVAYANGTVALAAALMVLGIKPEDEVLVPDMTFIATANAVILAGAQPVLCDIEKEGWQMSIESLKSKITAKTKVIMPVHLYGQSAEMDEIMSIAKEHKLLVLEDAAESIGTKYKNKQVGTIGDIGMISFYPNKIVTTGEGAVLMTDSAELAKELYKMKNHGREKKGIFIHESIGFNFSFSDLHAAVGISQMKKFNRIFEKKQNIYNTYKGSLADIPQISFYQHQAYVSPGYWFTNIQVPSAEKLEIFLRENGIDTRRFFYPLHLQPCYKGRFGSQFPNSLNAYNTGLSLPSSYGLSEEQQDHVITKLKEFFKT
jgi:perosamine synthetase